MIAFLIKALVKMSLLIIPLITPNLVNTPAIRDAFKSFALTSSLAMPIAQNDMLGLQQYLAN